MIKLCGVSKYIFLYFTVFVSFFPFLTPFPAYFGEHQPYYLLFFFISNLVMRKDIIKILNNNKFFFTIFILIVFFLATDYLINALHPDARYAYRYVNIIISFVFFSTLYIRSISNNWLFFCIVSFIYISVGLLQYAEILPAQLRSIINFSHREILNAEQLMNMGRGLPSLSTEAEAFMAVICSLIAFQLFYNKNVITYINIAIITSVFLICSFLAKSTTYYIYALLLMLFYASIQMLFSKNKYLLVIIFPIFMILAGLVLFNQPRTLSFFTDLFAGDLNVLAKNFGPSFIVRFTNISKLILIGFSLNYSDCVEFLYSQGNCINDALGFLGLYVMSPTSTGRNCIVLITWILIISNFTLGWKKRCLSFCLCTWSLLMMMSQSVNGPFFPLYLVIFTSEIGFLNLKDDIAFKDAEASYQN